MKQLLFICSIAVLAGCKLTGRDDAPQNDSAAASTAAATAHPLPDMPYQLSKSYKHWQTGDPQHAVTVMSSLKGFENNNMTQCMAGFADSVKIFFDGWEGNYSRDSLGKMFARQRNLFSGMTVKMQDWESVIAADKSEEWVTLWYKQIMTDAKGKVDSAECINDAMIKNGKIAVLSEAVRHYPGKK